MKRRDFMELAGGAAVLAAMSGCATGPAGASCGTAMTNFAAPPMEKIRIGFIGLGDRGTWAARRISVFPGVEAAALCDLNPARVDIVRKALTEKKMPGAMKEYKGKADSWKGLCDDPGVNVVYICTPAQLHVEMELYALRAGKHVMVEVPGAQTLEQCWEIVKTAEKARRHCMMLENACYGEMELLAWNLCHKGLLGTLTHAEGAYIHNLCWRRMEHPTAANNFRTLKAKEAALAGTGTDLRYGNTYPTHPLGPICMYLDVNRGDRMESIVSMSSMSAGRPEFAAATYGPDEWQNKYRWATGDMNTSIIRTARGRTIMLQMDTATPRPYSRINMVQGTRGFFRSFPKNHPVAAISKKPGGDAMGWNQKEYDLYEDDKFKELSREHMHPLFRGVRAAAAAVGGHGGMDFIMDLRWIWCLRNGLPLDMDVYDLASWSSIVPCSAMSDMRGGAPVEIPDFTCGAWRTTKPIEIGNVDLGKLGFDVRKIKKDKNSMEV